MGTPDTATPTTPTPPALPPERVAPEYPELVRLRESRKVVDAMADAGHPDAVLRVTHERLVRLAAEIDGVLTQRLALLAEVERLQGLYDALAAYDSAKDRLRHAERMQRTYGDRQDLVRRSTNEVALRRAQYDVLRFRTGTPDERTMRAWATLAESAGVPVEVPHAA